jgi:hypothetical protein
MRLLTLILPLMALGLIGCLTPPPEDVIDPPTYALACYDVDPLDCLIVAEAVRLPDRLEAPGAITVHEGRVRVMLADGAGLMVTDWSMDPAMNIAFGEWKPDPGARVTPSSGPAGDVIPFATGHCGLFSPIDVDGALWDPHGPVDAAAFEANNAAEGRFERTGQGTATFVADTGFRVGLLRHAGAGVYPLCD